MHDFEQPDAHHLGDATGIVTICLVDPRRQNSMHMSGLDADRGKSAGKVVRSQALSAVSNRNSPTLRREQSDFEWAILFK